MDIVFIVCGILGGIGLGMVISRFSEKSRASRLLTQAKIEADQMVKEARISSENLKRDKMLQAKERFLELKSEHEKVILDRDRKISEVEKRLRDKESQLNSELAKNKNASASLEQTKQEYVRRLELLDKRQDDLERAKNQQISQLEVIAGMTANEAKAQLLESLKAKAESEAMAFAKSKFDEAQLTSEQEAKRIIINTIQRIGT